MPTRRKKTRARSFSTTETTDRQITELLAKYDLLSDSEVVRRAVAELHQKAFPDYIYNKSATDIAKRQKLASEAITDALTPFEYADQVIGNGVRVVDMDDEEYYVVHTYANYLYPIKLSTIREELEGIQDIVQLHQNKVVDKPVVVDEYVLKFFQREHGIEIVEVFDDKNQEEVPNE